MNTHFRFGNHRPDRAVGQILKRPASAPALAHVSCKARATLFPGELSVRLRMSNRYSRRRPPGTVLREFRTRLFLQMKVRQGAEYSLAGKSGDRNSPKKNKEEQRRIRRNGAKSVAIERTLHRRTSAMNKFLNAG
jgi:hypothetical protein